MLSQEKRSIELNGKSNYWIYWVWIRGERERDPFGKKEIDPTPLVFVSR